jgi:23S rRNA-/tRNA-specific pseudouridylate synthase
MEFIKEFWQTLFQQLQNNQKVFLALVAAHTKGSPGTVGTKLWVSEEETLQMTSL